MTAVHLELDSADYAKIKTFPLAELGVTSLKLGDVVASPHQESSLQLLRPIRSGLTYVEIGCSAVLFATEFYLKFSCGGFIVLGFGSEEDDDGDDALILVLRDSASATISEDGAYKIEAFGSDNWNWCDQFRGVPNAIGFLVDMRRGCVTFRFNGMDGPCVAFPTSVAWRGGVSVHVKELPAIDKRSNPTGINCATPPIPQSLAATTIPRTISELVESGDLGAFVDDGE